MAQHFGLQIMLAVIGVDNLACPGAGQRVGQRLGHGHGVDGEVAPGQVFFKGDVGRCLHGKAFVAPGGFALGAGEGVFLAAFGVQKHRKVFAHGQKALRAHGLGRAAHHHPVAVIHALAHQGIAHRTADDKHLHGRRFAQRATRKGSSKSMKSRSASASSIQAFTPCRAHTRSM